MQQISIHALREEGDSLTMPLSRSRSHFYPRPPRGGRLLLLCMCRYKSLYFYPRPPRGGRPCGQCTGCKLRKHFYPRPPRGGRRDADATVEYTDDISIHALREEGDEEASDCEHQCIRFLSTPSARRATAKTETKSLFSNKLYNILHEFRRALIYNGSKNYPNHAK